MIFSAEAADKNVSNRGIVITPPFEFDGESISTKGPIDSVSIRQYLLYWDKMDWPDNNLISIGGETPEVLFLKEIGIVERTRVQFSYFSGNFGHSLLLMQEAALTLRNKKEPGCWSLAQSRSDLILPAEVSEPTRTIEVELYQSIPVPLDSVPLEDILNFKEKRKDELLQFRGVMDDLYQEVISARDIPRAKITAIQKIERNLADLNRVFNDSWKEKLLSTIRVELNLPNLATHAVVGVGLGAVFGFSPEVGAAIGAATAALKMDFRVSPRGKNIPSELKDYAYLHSFESELK